MNKMFTMTKINEMITKYNDKMLKLLETSLKLNRLLLKDIFRDEIELFFE